MRGVVLGYGEGSEETKKKKKKKTKKGNGGGGRGAVTMRGRRALLLREVGVGAGSFFPGGGGIFATIRTALQLQCNDDEYERMPSSSVMTPPRATLPSSTLSTTLPSPAPTLTPQPSIASLQRVHAEPDLLYIYGGHEETAKSVEKNSESDNPKETKEKKTISRYAMDE